LTVYVDDAYIEAQLPGMRPAKWCHLTADTKGELHEFAERIGLRRSWFQDKPAGLWHYDVTKTVRARAVAAGAEQIGYMDSADFNRVYRRPGREGGLLKFPVYEATPVEWEYNAEHPSYRGRRWMADCPFDECPKRLAIWFTEKELKRGIGRDEAGKLLNEAMEGHVRDNHAGKEAHA
jgi:hypothetical protein